MALHVERVGGPRRRRAPTSAGRSARRCRRACGTRGSRAARAARPVAIEVSADAVVAGTTVVIGPPVHRRELGHDRRRARAARSSPGRRARAGRPPRPSRAGSGSHESSCTPSSAGTSPATEAPSSAGRTAPTRDEVIERQRRTSVGAGRGDARAASARRWGHEDVDPRRLRRPSAAVARAARHRAPDLREGDRRAHAPPAAVPRADPAVGEGRRARALEARRRRRLRARPRDPTRSRSPTSSPRSKARRSCWPSTPTTARGTASCRRSGSASTTSRAASSSASRSPSSSSAPASVTPTRSRLADGAESGDRSSREAFEHGFQLGRQRFVEPHPLARSRDGRTRACAACRNGRAERDLIARTAVGAVADDRDDRSPTRCTRIWCVRPVSSLHSSRLHSGAPNTSTTSYSVRACLPALAHRHARAARAGTADRRVDHAARRGETSPDERHVQRARPCAPRAARRASRSARAERATASSPLVSRSSRCTMPGRIGSPTVSMLGEPREQPVDERARARGPRPDAPRVRRAWRRPRRRRRRTARRRRRRVGLGPHVGVERRLVQHLEHVALVQPVALGDDLAVDQHRRRRRSGPAPRRAASRSGTRARGRPGRRRARPAP